MISELVTTRHLSRKAVVYVRQSHPHQVLGNQESLRLQYGLCQRARDLGWQEADVEVVDADLGLSGAAADHRRGFKDLIARVTLGEVGIILSYDVTRLARNCSDWYPLLDLCGFRQCLIADRDGVYDPGSANGRLLLGLKGTISEVELHTMRGRLTAGLLSKAERGELALHLPAGLTRDASPRKCSTGSAIWSSRGSTCEASSTSRSVRMEATIRPVTASKPMCSLRHERRLLVPCFSTSHSPGPPVSARNCRPAGGSVRQSRGAAPAVPGSGRAG